MSTRLALQVAYDGRRYAGWQIQPDRPTVQAALEAALTGIAGAAVKTICAGRTDAGVHALAQVVHFDAPSARPLTAWVRGVNALLGDDVAVVRAWPVADDFHARFQASARRYGYLLRVGAVRDPLWSGRAGWSFRGLDHQVMRDAAQCLIGRHDFSSFRAAQCQARSPVRTISRLSIRRRGDWLFIDIEADAFLHHMVRNIVAALVAVGSGSCSRAWLEDLLHARDRRLGAPTFAPDGLYFLGPTYPQPGGPVVECDLGWLP
ncbi:MAG: tRNA pseudouridine(38-40) synthase TruA [Burkholderiaceae bacterium]